ncbi:hypothetical protein GCM10022214_39010 [Actinomadura miaoliensis]|uniref:Uncharacterized protein n=1 Tax=Actinomadura miaoliensis TaxID=430685 RepID=A0ABP7VYR1_9ACTN
MQPLGERALAFVKFRVWFLPGDDPWGARLRHAQNAQCEDMRPLLLRRTPAVAGA